MTRRDGVARGRRPVYLGRSTEKNTKPGRGCDVYANPALRQYVRARAENRPGVYRMMGSDGELLYVGKSVHVRTRLLSYFRAPRGDKAWELIREATRVTWEYVPNEFAALVREMKLIQRRLPRYNVQHTRKRAYAFVKVTREAAPRLLPVTRVADDGATYYGPFPRVAALAYTVRDLTQVMGLRDCPGPTPVFFSDQIELFGGGRPPRCLRAELGTCLAPCCGRPTEVDYGRAVEAARRFLEGRASAPLRELRERMDEAARRTEFEYAAILRDRIERLERLRDELVAFRGRMQSLDLVYRVPGFRGDDRLYLIRKGRIRRELAHPTSERARADVARAVEEVYGEAEPGPLGLRPEDAAEILLVAQWFRLRPRERRRAVAPRRWLAASGPAAGSF